VPERYVSLTEAAIHKGVHYQTVRRAIARGALKAQKVGGGVIIAASDLDGWQPEYTHAPRHPRWGAPRPVLKTDLPANDAQGLRHTTETREDRKR